MHPQTIQALLVTAGWVVSFLLGKELATGFLAWRARATRPALIETDPDPDRPRR